MKSVCFVIWMLWNSWQATDAKVHLRKERQSAVVVASGSLYIWSVEHIWWLVSMPLFAREA